MAAPVTNQSYTQQINQAFDMLKYATPQQMQVVSQQVQQNPNSPEAMALAMAVQYQQQARAPRPQAPQGTVLQQKLQEFQQTSPQGLPQVGQNQMAMQQAAQQNPMFGAGIAVAPENTEQAPAPQQMAATGGITALARGGEVRGFADGRSAWWDKFTSNADRVGGKFLGDYGFTPERSQVASPGLPSIDIGEDPNSAIDLGGDPNSPYGTYKPPEMPIISDMGAPPNQTSPRSNDPVSEIIYGNKPKPKTGAHHNKKDAPPAPNSSAAANAASPTAKSETYVGPNALTGEESIAYIKKLLGPEADMSEEVAMAKEAARGVEKANLGNFAVQAIAGYIDRDFAAGLRAAGAQYMVGSKTEQEANKEVRALQMASKKAELEPHKVAAKMWLDAQTKEAEVGAASKAKLGELEYTQKGTMDLAKFNAGVDETLELIKGLNARDLEALKSGTLSAEARLNLYGQLAVSGRYNAPEISEIVESALKTARGTSPSAGSGSPFAPLGNSGYFHRSAPQ